jgi:predicted nucleic acid-binding protein
LAEELSADQLIVDELLGRREAEQLSVPVIGSVGVLRESAEMGLLDLGSVFDRLRQTGFDVFLAIFASLLDGLA